MEDYLRYGLLFIAGVILFLILLESLLRRRRLRIAETTALNQRYLGNPTTIAEEGCAIHLPDNQKMTEPTIPLAPPNYLMISIFARVNSHFAAYDLLQALATAGLQFGEMNIFHYYHRINGGKETLFSLASATKPGDFDLNQMGDFSCLGLTLFMDIDSGDKPEFAFEKMLATAEQLAEDLDGELRASPHRPWNQDVLNEYRQRIAVRRAK